MGVLVNVPVALAPGMGLNGYFNTISKDVRLFSRRALAASGFSPSGPL